MTDTRTAAELYEDIRGGYPVTSDDAPAVCGDCEQHRNAPHAHTHHKKPYCKHFKLEMAADKKACRSPWAIKRDDGQGTLL